MDELYAELLAEAEMPSMIAPMAAPADTPAASSDETGADPAGWASSLSNGTAAPPATPTLGRKSKARPGPANLLHELLHGPPTITAAAEDTDHEGLMDASPEEGATAQSGTPAEIFLGYTVNTDGETGEVWVPGPGQHTPSPAVTAADEEALQPNILPGTSAYDDTMVDVMLDSPDSELEELPALQAQPITGSGSEAESELTEDPSNSSEPEASCSTGVPHRPPPAVTPRSGVYVHSQACQAVPATRSVSVQAEGSAIDDAIQKRTMPRPLPAPKYRREGRSSDLSCPFLRVCLGFWVVHFSPVMYTTADMYSLFLQAEVMMCDDARTILTWQDIAAVPCPHVHAPCHTCPPKQQDAAESPGTLVIRPDRLDPTELVCCACSIHGTMLCTSLTAGSATCGQLSSILGGHLARTVSSVARVDCHHQMPRSWMQNAALCTERTDPSWDPLPRSPCPRRGIMHRHSRAIRACILRFLSGLPVGRGAIASFAIPVRTAPWCLPDKPDTCPPMPPPWPSLCAQDMERLYSSSSGSSETHDATDYPSRESQLDVSVEHDRILLVCPHLDPQVPVSATEAARIVFQAWKELTTNTTRHSRLMSSGTSRQVRPRLIAHSTSGISANNPDTALPSVTHTQHDEWCRALGQHIDAELNAMPDADRDRAVQRLLLIIRRDAPDASCCALSFLWQLGDQPHCTLRRLRMRSCDWGRPPGHMNSQQHHAPFSMLRRKTALLHTCCICTYTGRCQWTCSPQQHIHATVHHVIPAKPSHLSADPHRWVGCLKPLNCDTAPLLGCCDILPALFRPQCTRLVFTALHKLRLLPSLCPAAGLFHLPLHYMHQALHSSARARLPALQQVCGAKGPLLAYHDIGRWSSLSYRTCLSCCWLACTAPVDASGKIDAIYSTMCHLWGAHYAQCCSQCIHFHAYASHETTLYPSDWFCCLPRCPYNCSRQTASASDWIKAYTSCRPGSLAPSDDGPQWPLMPLHPSFAEDDSRVIQGMGEEDDPLKPQQTTASQTAIPRAPLRHPGRLTPPVLLHARTGNPPLRRPLLPRPGQLWPYDGVSMPGMATMDQPGLGPLRTVRDVHPHPGHTPNLVEWTVYASRVGHHRPPGSDHHILDLQKTMLKVLEPPRQLVPYPSPGQRDRHLRDRQLSPSLFSTPLQVHRICFYHRASHWSIGASVIAPAVTDTLNGDFAALPEPPQPELTDISLCLLPKPAKVAQQPADVRPISLLHPVNKIQAGMLARIVKPYLTSYLQDIPQYAYVSERSAPEALCRVFSHLYKVRQNAPTKEGMVQRRQQGVLRTECKGGITFSLDVAKAFDTIPRWVIKRACEDAQIPPEVIQHITAVHEQLNVGLCHFGHKGSCRTSRGIRQGCNLAPSLWSLATAYVHRHLRSTLGPEIDSIITWFADDVIAQWQVQSIQELRSALSQLSALVAALRQFGMDVSSQKSVILYSLHGTKAAQFLHSSRIKRADKWHLRTSPDLDFPIVRQHKYLGVIISYGSFETHTLDHRMKCASATFARLRHILCTKNVLSTAKRVLLWRTIVWPTLKYGLSSLLMSYKDHARLTGYVARQLRTITGQLAHLTHEPTHDFLRKWNARPGTSLHAEVVTNQQRYHRQTGLCAERVTQWFHLLLATYNTDESLPSASRLTPVEAIVTQVHQCQDWPSCFATAGLLKIHRVKAHKYEKVTAQRKQAQMQNQVEHSLKGVPTCRHCKHEFNGWRNFNTHILLGNCPVLGLRSAGSSVPNASTTGGTEHSTEPTPQTTAMPESAYAPTISLEATYQELQVTRGDQWKLVTQNQALRSRMKNHCPECNLYAADSPRIKVHMKAKHHDSLDLLEHAEALSSCVRTGKPCLYCGQHIPKTTFEGTHAVGCFVLWQTMYVMLQSGVIPSGLDYDSKRFRNSRWGRARLVSEVHAEPTDRRGRRDGTGKGGQAAEDPDGTEGRQWKTREGQGQPSRANGTHSIQAFLRKIPKHERPEPAPAVSAADPNGPPPGGCTADHSPRHLLRRVAQDGLASRGTGGDVHGSPEVERAEGTRGSQGAASTCALDVSSDRAGGQDKSSQVDGGTEGTSGKDGLSQGRSLAVPEMVFRRGTIGSGHRSLPTLHARCPSAGEGSFVSVSGSLSNHAVPSHTAPCPGAEGPQHHVLDVSCTAVGASQRTPLDPPEAGRQCLHTDRRHVTSSGKTQPLQPREAALEVPADRCTAIHRSRGVTDHAHAGGTPAPAIPASMGGPSTHIDQQLVLRAKLLNRSNTCYTNAVVHALLWLACRTCSPTMPSGLMKAFQVAIKDRKGLHVWQLLAWRQLMKDWAQPNRQHDAAELFTFFQDRGFADMFEGNWQRRTLTDGNMCVEEAGSTMPLLLPTPLFAHCTPQNLLDTWYTQAGFAGLLTAPTHLIVQINRFATAEDNK